MTRLILLLLFVSCLLLGAPTVVVISIDGFPAYALNDPQAAAPTLRRLIREGATATNGMEPVNPTVTWPNHTAMLTGVDASKHGVLYNGMPVRTPGKPVRIEPWVPKSELVVAPTVYDLAHKAGLKTAEVDWVAIQDAPSIDFSFSEVPKPDARIVREMMERGSVTRDEIQRFAQAPITWRDEIWTEAAVHILREHQPNLLLFHLLTTDSVQHRYGARSLGAQTALALADLQVQRILDTLKETGSINETTVLVVSDHGFVTARRLIQPNAVLSREKLIRGGDCDAWTIAEGGTAMVYITNEGKRAELRKRLPEIFRAVDGVQQVISPEQFSEHGFPPPGPGSRMADLVLAAAEGYAFGGKSDGPPVADIPPGASSGNHGYLRTNREMRAIFVAWGNGIRPGSTVKQMRNVDIAPTIARLLGLEMKDTAGRILTEILK